MDRVRDHGTVSEVDLNADLGEGFGVWRLGEDDALLDVLTSANVACGFHAGDPTTMRRVCLAAAERGVAIGALDAFARLAGTRVRYVKPHGALYNTAVADENQAAAVVAAVTGYDRSLP